MFIPQNSAVLGKRLWRWELNAVVEQDSLTSCVALVTIVYAFVCTTLINFDRLKDHVAVQSLSSKTVFEWDLPTPTQTPPAPALDPARNAAYRISPPEVRHSKMMPPTTPVKTQPTLNPVAAIPAVTAINNIPAPPPAVSVPFTSTAPADTIPSATGLGANSGSNGTGTGDLTPAVPLIASSPPAVSPEPAQGNIAPYKIQMLNTLAKRWHPAKNDDQVVVQFKIAKDGALLDSQILRSTSKKAAQQVQRLVDSASFEPLPAWFSGQSITFAITMDAYAAGGADRFNSR